jgi:SAM-dependent methyltransferase
VLDVCCGSGGIGKSLRESGWEVFGIDGSFGMLRQADVNWVAQADARRFAFRPETFDAAISTFDVINHMLSEQDVAAVFANVRSCLKEKGVFIFDVLLEQAYRYAWNQIFAEVDDESASFVRGGYDPEEHWGFTEITVFENHNGCWARSDTRVEQRCWPDEWIEFKLREAGFQHVKRYDVAAELNILGDFAFGRAAFVATVP